MKVNNTIFQRKQRYMIAMREIEIIKRQTEYEAINGQATKDKLQEITLLWNLTFVGLLREGLKYQYIKNEDNPQKDTIRLTIDNVHYNCLASTVKSILKDNFYEILKINRPISEKELDESAKELLNLDLTVDKNSQMTSNATKDTVDENKNDNKAEDAVECSDEKSETEKVSTDEEELIIESPPVNVPFETEVANKENKIEREVIEYNFKEEAIKTRHTFVYDEYLLSVFLPGAPVDNQIECIVAPLYMHDNNLHPEIVVMMKSGKNIQTFISAKERPSITAQFLDNEFIISGAFKNGEFQSYIYPSGITAAKDCAINKELKEHRSDTPKATNYGHNLIKRDNTEIHIIPITQENDKNGSATVMFCTINDKSRIAITNHGTVESFLTLNNEKIQILSYWQDNVLSCDILQ